jgi:hypothetical protein
MRGEFGVQTEIRCRSFGVFGEASNGTSILSEFRCVFGLESACVSLATGRRPTLEYTLTRKIQDGGGTWQRSNARYSIAINHG